MILAHWSHLVPTLLMFLTTHHQPNSSAALVPDPNLANAKQTSIETGREAQEETYQEDTQEDTEYAWSIFKMPETAVELQSMCLTFQGELLPSNFRSPLEPQAPCRHAIRNASFKNIRAL